MLKNVKIPGELQRNAKFCEFHFREFFQNGCDYSFIRLNNSVVSLVSQEKRMEQLAVQLALLLNSGADGEVRARGPQEEAAEEEHRRGVRPVGLPFRVERFDRRPIEPFELFTSEFGQNSVRIQENLSRIFRKFLKSYI